MWFNILKAYKNIPFMVKNEIWDEAYSTTEVIGSDGRIKHISAKGQPTVLEFEEALGRKLTNEDFDSAPLNWSPFLGDDPLNDMWSRLPEQASILRNRIGGKEGAKKLMRKYLVWHDKYGDELEFTGEGREIHIKRAKFALGE